MCLPEHGANPHTVYEKLGMEQPSALLDFSENVNPAGPPKRVLEEWPHLVERITAYPDPQGEPFLSAVATFHKVSKEALFIGNGAAELLAFIAERYRGKKAIVVHPTFSEYEATLRAKQVEVIHVLASEDDRFQLPIEVIREAMEQADVLYLCTPNNPTGILPSQAELTELIYYGAEVNCDIVLDEAFIDFIDESLSFIPKIKDFPHVIVVRSMTKMYAIPGIRLGYVVANPTIISGIKTVAPHWNVNGIAAFVGEICLNERAFREQTIRLSNERREEMKAFLQMNGCTVTDSKANFLTFKLGKGRTARKLYEDLLQRGIVLRHSENFRGMDGEWLRIGMKKAEEMAVLQGELKRWFLAN